MAFAQWRGFNFFENVPEVDGGQLKQSLNESGASITCVTSGRSLILVGDTTGRVHALGRDYSIRHFKPFQTTVETLELVKQTSLLIVVGKDQPETSQSVLKVFDLDKQIPDVTANDNDRLMNPVCLRTTKGLGSDPHLPSKVTCVTVDDTLTTTAVGFDDGSLVLYRGELGRDRSRHKKSVLLKPGRLNTQVLGAVFRTIPGQVTWLYVVTTEKVLAFNASQMDRIGPPTVLDTVKSHLFIPVEGNPDVHFITASGETGDIVYFYTHEGRGQGYPIEGKTTGLHWFRTYLVVSYQAGQRLAATNQGKERLSIIDVMNKFKALHTNLFVKPVRAVVDEWGSVYVVSEDDDEAASVYKLTERDIQTKLDSLFKTNFYDLAIRIARSNQYDTYGLKDIYRQYGDHLYSKRDYTGAIENYVKTTGHLEPSYVIRKFLDIHRIHDLTTYLKALHKSKEANKDHTILLLNCYTKLKDEESLKEFIYPEEGIDFDVDIAIKVLRQSGYFGQAAMLADRHADYASNMHLHECYLEIQLEDLKDYGRALEYISKLEFTSAESNMEKYGGILMQNLPGETVAFLKLLCTDYRKSDDPIGQGDRDKRQFSNPDNYLRHFFKCPQEAIDFLEHIVRENWNASELVFNSLLENYLQSYSRAIKEQEPAEVVSALAEKIMSTLKHDEENPVYDTDHALVMCQLHQFHPGTLHLYKRKGLHGEILKHYMEKGDLSQVVETCRNFGDQNPGLWLQTLQFVAKDCTAQPEQVAEILSVIESQHLMPPLLVVRTLASSPSMQFGMVRDFLRKSIKAEDDQTKRDKSEIDKYRQENADIRSKIRKLKSEAVVFTNTKCDICRGKLELQQDSAVHFLCQCSFHNQCYQTSCSSETDGKCPKCFGDNQDIVSKINAQLQNHSIHDSFHSQLYNARGDRFAVVADYFSRGLFRIHGRSVNPMKITTVRPKPAAAGYSEAVKVEAPVKVERLVVPSKISPPINKLSPSLNSRTSVESKAALSQASSSAKSGFSPAAAAAADNPFYEDNGEDDFDENNPFGSSAAGHQSSAGHGDDGNPFGDDMDAEDDSKNPFGEPVMDDDDYDEAKNPFAE